MIRIANGQGFWGDWLEAPVRLVEQGPIDYLALDYIVLTLNHARGAGYYAMAGQGFDPNFTFSWPTARIGVMEGESAVNALYAVELEKYKGKPLPPELQEAIERTRADYERWLDARYAAARGHCDAVIDPLDSRRMLSFALEASAARSDPWPPVPGPMEGGAQ